MKYFLTLLVSLLITGSLSAQKENTTMKEPYGKEFRKSDSFLNQGLPQSAVTILKEIYNQAKEARQPVQMLKAQVYLMNAATAYKEDADTVNIHLAVTQATAAPFPYNAIWHSIAAELYHNYYTNHRWQVMGRSTIFSKDSQPIDEWDANHFFRVIKEHYDASLADENALQKIDLTDFESLLLGDKKTRYLRPLLYDLLAFRAINYYTNAEAGITKPADHFTISEMAWMTAAPNEFSRLSITSKEEASTQLSTLKIYQKIFRIHQNDLKPDALIDADLHRLKFVYNHAVFPQKKEKYLTALRRIAENNPNNPTAAEASYRMLALQYDEPYQPKNSGDKKAPQRNLRSIKEQLETIVRKFPESEGGANAQRLLSTITIPTLALVNEEVIVPDEYSKALVTYKNTPKVWGRILKLSESNYELVGNNEKEAAKKILLGLKSIQEFSQALPSADDYETHTTELPISPLPKGIYALLISGDEAFSTSENNLCYVLFQASEISMVAQQGTGMGYVLHRKTGKPLSGANLSFYNRQWTNGKYSWIKKTSATSGTDGLFQIKKDNNLYSQRTIVRLGADLLYQDAGFSAYDEPEGAVSSTRSFFFTDRSIYRPGQTVFFKAIIFRMEGVASKTKVLANESATVRFEDVNGQLVKEINLKTNEYGSVAGSFLIPNTGLTGMMTISNAWGSTNVSVEEYKRPKFEVVFDTLKSSYALNEQVTITGIARAYAGNVIDGAQVKYRVVRQTRWPYPWLFRRMMMPDEPAVEISNGTVPTDAQGKFKISFLAKADEGVDASMLPIFRYTIYADVTDAAGETHSSTQVVSAGYRGIEIHVAVPAQPTPKELEKLMVRITNLNGQPLIAEGHITITPLKSSKVPFRHRLWAQPEFNIIDEATFRKNFPLDEYLSESKPQEWAALSHIYVQSFMSNEAGTITIAPGTFKGGWYLITISAKDKSSGALVMDKQYVEVMDGIPRSPISVVLEKEICEPGMVAKATVATGFTEAYILQMEAAAASKISIKGVSLNGANSNWSHLIKETDRGGINLQWLMVKDNRVYIENKTIAIPWSNKELSLSWATHRDKLAPGAKETWSVTIKGNKKDKVAAELLAGLYDASLDALKPHSWSIYDLFSRGTEYFYWDKQGGFGVSRNRNISYMVQSYNPAYAKQYEYLLVPAHSNLLMSESIGFADAEGTPRRSPVMALGAVSVTAKKSKLSENVGSTENAPQSQGSPSQDVITKVDPPLRKNLQETAFFFPQLQTDANGSISFSFTLPEALTEWKFMALGHTKEMATGQLTGSVKTQKDLMVQPNLPRFFRQGDDMVITTKISNLSNLPLSGNATLEIVDAQTLQSANLPFRVLQANVSFSVNKAQSTTASWRIHIPESRYEPVLIRISAQAGNFKDGEENMLPVLTNRTLVTETLPLWINGAGTKNFSFEKLLKSDESSTLAQHRLTVEYTSNPAWYALQALPYLMEYPYECAEQTFNRYYANALAAHILEQAPRVKEIFAQWKTTDTAALISNLQKNESLKSAILEETPWVLDAQNETKQKQNIARLFDTYKLGIAQEVNLGKLKDMLLPEGAFSWFKGGTPDRYITQYVATGLARLRHLGVVSQPTLALEQKLHQYLDRAVQEDYQALLKAKVNLKDQQLSYLQIQYLYLRSLNPDYTAGNVTETAFKYYLDQSSKYWPKYNPYMKGMMALALNKLGNKSVAQTIIQSLRETAIYKEELGMYWMEPGNGYWWYEAPVEAQALLIECFNEVAKDEATVNELKRWLLKQKQTQDWKATKATADACYALLLTGTQWLTNSPQVSITLGEKKVIPSKTEAGTGYFKEAFAAGDVKPAMGNITLNVSSENTRNPKEGTQPSYGAVYWQYFENYDKITSAATPLALRRQIFKELNTASGPVLEEVGEGAKLKVGDKVKIRIVLQADRAMEYLHLKDTRAAVFEPVNVLSGYRWQDGLGYYESTRDASSKFFISYLKKGTYVFEYTVLVMAKGNCSNGFSSIQCMYAPEFSSHSAGMRVIVE